MAHLTAINEFTRVHGLHGPDKLTPGAIGGAIGGLALSAASVSSTHIGACELV